METMIGLGLLLSHILPDTALATYTYILVSYHLVLAFKVFTADRKAGMSLPLSQTILSHLAFVGLLIGIAVGRHHIPFFGIIRYFIPGLAPFEASWLFNGEKKKVVASAEPAAFTPSASGALPANAPAEQSLYMSSTGDDFEEFRLHLGQSKRPFRRPGISIKEEYELWLAHRVKTRAAASSTARTA
jgi:hypothetical protein